MPELKTPIRSTKSTLTAFSPILLYSPWDPKLSFEDLFETGPHSHDMPSPPPMNPIFQPVQEPDITTSNKETPASILPSLSSSKVELQLQQISAERPFSPASKIVEDTTLDPSTIPNLLSMALRPPSPQQPQFAQITQATLPQVQQPPFPSTTTSYIDNLSYLVTSPTDIYPTLPIEAISSLSGLTYC